ESVSYGFRERLREMERHPRILSAGLATVQPWLDIPELGSAVVIVADGDADLGREHCARLAAEGWARRRGDLPGPVPVEEAVRRAHDAADGLVVLSDSADSTTSGAPGDSTWVLRELLRYDWPRPALVTLVDPEVVEDARRAGVDNDLDALLGGK